MTFNILLTFVLISFCNAIKQYKHTSITSDGITIDTILDANEPTLCDPNVQQYSGYLRYVHCNIFLLFIVFDFDVNIRAGGTTNDYFYWFFESRNSPSTSPLIMWLTGGPGCSSILALLTENGPCKVNEFATDTTLNPYSWNKNSNIMWVDQRRFE